MASRIKQHLTILSVVLLALTAFFSPAMAQDSAALVRFVHAIPGAAAVDIYANGTLAIADLSAGTASPHLSVPAGDYTLTVRQAGVDAVLWEQDVTLAAGSAQTLIAATTQPLTFQLYPDDLAPLRLGTARFTAIHAIAAGPAVDVLLSDGRPVVSGLSFGQVYGTLDIPALAYDLAVAPAGEGLDNAIVATTSYPLSSGTSYSLLIFGTIQRPQTMLLAAPTQPDGAAGFLRLVHAFPGADAVDVLVNGVPFTPALAFGSETTPFAALPPGDYEVTYRDAGTDNDLATVNVTLAANSYATVVVFPDDGNIGAQAFVTDLAAITATESVFNVVNLLPGSATTFVALNNGTPLSGDVGSGQTSAAIVEPVATGATVTVMDSGDTRDLAVLLEAIYGGVYYDLLIVEGQDGPQTLLLEPVSIAQTVGSAPGSSVVVAEPADEVVTEPEDLSEEVVILEPTTEAAEAPAPTEVAEVATEAPPTEVPPTATPAPPTATPTAVPTQGPPTARVLLDPGANLQMRQYPSSQAFSLGLAPAGATLTVIGRQGAEVLSPFQTPDPEATEWVDPVSLLGEGESLDRLSTWLFVSYETAEGGQINAWVNSFYVSVNAPNGDLVSLRSLPTVPSNRAGQAFNTVVGVPTLEEALPQAIVGGLDDDVNLQIRRTPDVAGESLTLVPNDTALDLLGMNEARSWAFVRYETDEGSVTGWANALFLVEYTYEGETLTFNELESRNLIETIDESQRGTEAGDVAPPAAPTRAAQADAVLGEVLLNPGANLQLRRNPDTQAESLALIPAGEEVVITARTDNAAWLRATYDGRTGWVAAAYIRLTRNGRAYGVQLLPVEGPSLAAPETAGIGGEPAEGDDSQEPADAPSPTPTEELAIAEIVVDVVAMTTEPGGSGEGLPVLTRGRQVYFFYLSPDMNFAFIRLMDADVVGWVPAFAVLVR